MPIYIYNSLSRKKELFIPLNPPEIKMYVCGPTVYDEPHIGHARSAYIFDVIRRYLVYRGYKVRFVRNVTDVDDKIIDKARKEFKGENLNDAVGKVANKYLNAYHADMKSLGILEPDAEPRATEYVSKENPAMQKFIGLLIERGYAYVSDGDVYFDIKKAKNYGKLSGQSLENMEAGARILPGEKKRDPLDFALWKRAKEDEPAWDSPWGKGRPGWHIECSAMSSQILGDEFDIHGGGLDLIFPHHENEIAQSEGAGKNFARFWIHHGLLTINGQKMAKSLGNFVTVKDALEEYPADVLKLFYLNSLYASPVDFTEQQMEEAKKKLERISIFFKKTDSLALSVRHQVPVNKYPQIEAIENEFIAAMDDNFNTQHALVYILALVTLANKKLADVDFVITAKSSIQQMMEVLGLDLKEAVLDSVASASNSKCGSHFRKIGKLLGIVKDIVIDERAHTSSGEIRRLIQEREQLRKRRRYDEADKIRKELEGKGIILEDTKEGTTWRRKL